ncbi:MAG: caspase family protein [Saprospiraceae bacterium]|nr:caspase family protein [Saprospiraceae bacterium]
MTADLLVVGETYFPKNHHQGFVAMLHPETGVLIKRIQFDEKSSNDYIFHDIAQVGDGSFYVAGYCLTKQAPEALLIHLDEHLEYLERIPLGLGVIEHINILEDNSLILVGKTKKDDPNVLVIKYSRGKVQKQQVIGNKQYADVVGLATTNDNHILICGNTAKSSTSQEGDIWIAKLDEQINFIGDKIIDNKGWDEVVFASNTFDGNLILAGGTQGTFRDVLLIEIDTNFKISSQTLKGPVDEYANGVIRTFEGHYIMTQYLAGQSLNEALLLRGFKPFSQITLNEFGNPLEVRDVYYGYRGKYFVAGIEKTEKKLINARIECLSNEGTLVKSKSLSEVKIQITEKPRLEDKSGDGILAPEERAEIVFKIKNIGTSHLKDAIIKIIPKNLTGVSYFGEIYISYLPANTEKQIRIPFNGQSALKSGGLDAMIQLVESDRVLLEIPIYFKSKDNGSGGGSNIDIIVDWGNPGLRGNNREIRTTEPVIEMPVQAYHNRPLVEKDFKPYLNGTLLEDQKAVKGMVDTVKTRDIYSSTIRIQIPLQEGRNELYVRAEKEGKVEVTSSIIIYYEPRLPNLHVLAIGAMHADLKYTAKDAQEFAATMRKQEGLGLYHEVFVQELITEQETSCQNIKASFERLSSRYEQTEGRDKITEKDVLVVFISSHGKIVKGNFVIVPSDYASDTELSTTVDYKRDIIKFLDKIKCKKVVFIDACHSGAAGSRTMSSNPNITSILNELNAASPGLVSIGSCSNQELSFEDSEWENGAFTEALLEALNNDPITLSNGRTVQCDQPNTGQQGALSIEEIYEFLRLRVPDLAKQKSRTQTPTMPSLEDLDKKLNIFTLPK